MHSFCEMLTIVHANNCGLQIGLETSEARFDETAFSRIEEHLAGTDRNRAMQLNPIKSCAAPYIVAVSCMRLCHAGCGGHIVT